MDRELTARTGFCHIPGFLTAVQQDEFVAAARNLAAAAPLQHPRMRDGRPLTVRVSSFGERGWWADEQGYRYIERHPTGVAFPPIPMDIAGATRTALWDAGADRWIDDIERHVASIDTCRVNLYAPGAQLGRHIDQTERDRVSPIVTFSVGASCTFAVWLEDRGEPRAVRCVLHSGDAVVMAGPSRLAEHMVTDVRPAPQGDLFGGNYDPLHKTAPGTRLSFTVRRTGY